MTSPSQALTVLEGLGFTPEQSRILLNARVTQGNQHALSDGLLEEFAGRCAGNGLHADLAGWWANRLEEGFDGHQAAADLVARTVTRLRSNGLTASEAKALSDEFMAALGDIRKASANVVDTTAVVVG